MDLLTVVTHELGHILGLADVSATFLPDDLMDTTLPTGTRRLPTPTDVDAVFAGGFETTTATPLAMPQAFTLATPITSDHESFAGNTALAQAWAAWQSDTNAGTLSGDSGSTDGSTTDAALNNSFGALGPMGRWLWK
jgi:hypothetical protein